ncbi:efflux RND transporter periplasmic adaptor subunit [candidate division CSSED10-310 bacterium]|uniref:Efflux RND transporter periplasmic adaptor subunit n=1 Tax=candidate division CSSED10-310 bacterium TaxID=2855610 RepID=A0ABV6Z1K1_UNCC1
MVDLLQFLLTISVLIAILSGPIGCSKSTTTQKKNNGNADKRPISVVVEPLSRGTLQRTVQFLGELTTLESVQVAAEISGRLSKIVVQMGDRVSRHQLLATIDDTQLRAQLSEAKAALAVAEAAIRRATAEFHNAEAETNRKQPLIKKNLITQQEIDNLRTKVDSLTAARDLAEAQLKQARARVMILETQLGYTKIVAPFGGLIETRQLDPGAVVNPGMMIMKIVKVDPIIITFMVGEQLIGQIKDTLSQGQSAIAISLDAYEGETFQGSIARVSPVLKASNRSAKIEAELANPDGRLMPGMYGRVTFTLGKRENVIMVPLRALLAERNLINNSGGKQVTSGEQSVTERTRYLFVVDGDKVRLTTCLIGIDDGKHGEVVRGPAEGAMVVVEGQNDLVDGSPVIISGSGK